MGKKYHGWKKCPYGGKGAVGGTAAYCIPADGQGAAEDMHTLALCQIFQVAVYDGAEAFAAAVAEYGAPAVLTGDESGGIDVSAYGFSVPGSSGGVLTELEGLTNQVKVMEEKVVPHMGGASVGGAPTGAIVCITVPTEEFPGGVDLVPLRHAVPSVAIGPPVSAVACSFEATGASFVETDKHSEHRSIDEFRAGSAEEEFPPEIYEELYVGAPATGISRFTDIRQSWNQYR
ncbi:hypothetical protein CYMTET_35916 [Cymbomonas tetramitiformis]|uniref:Uncharacterized protein n=1 Tax=Cymbomonas tetramitiformis TaxID=36881 RepID=A0AAE0KNJ1_9CHLO|nr:hypothetical protein CYMTET_35916 [Cymbomonas tetramitiformis]